MGNEGNGKSSVANLLLLMLSFLFSDDEERCTTNVQSQLKGDIKVYDCPGFGNRDGNDDKTTLSIIEKVKQDKINAIFLVFNATLPRVDEQIEKFITLICKMFVGKYIWKHIGIIFTHSEFGFTEKKREKFMKKLLDICQKEYDNITRNQRGENKTQDANEKLVETLPCFFVNSKWQNGYYDAETLRQREKIIQFAKQCAPITEVASKIWIRDEVIKGLTKPKVEYEKIDQGAWGSFKRGVAHAGFVYTVPYAAVLGGACKLIGLPFDNKRLVNEMGDEYFKLVKGDYNVHDDISNEIGIDYFKTITIITYDKRISYYVGRDPEITEENFSYSKQNPIPISRYEYEHHD